MKKINYMTSCRKAAGLSQGDITTLIGKKSISTVSKMEDGVLTPDLKTALYLSFIFSKSIPDLFAKLHQDCAYEVLRKTDLLDSRLNSQTSKDNHKKVFLSSMIASIKEANY